VKTDSKVWAPMLVGGTGAAIGILGAVLAKAGNPPNMGLCIACFIRDIAGALGLHRAASVQYLRPELPGLVLGAMLGAAMWGELKGRSAPSPAVSFLLGALVTIGALVFLGCPVRLVLRLGGGDLNALTGLGGFAMGIFIGTLLLRRGFSLGRTAPAPGISTLVLPVLAAGLVVLAFVKPAFIFFSTKGPGSMAAPVLLSLGAGLAVGFMAHRSRMCFVGGIRDMLLIHSPHLLFGLGAALAAGCVTNLLMGQFKLGFAGQPVAHTEHLWNVLAMALV
jgi:YedE family putative selenium metabolism protein